GIFHPAMKFTHYLFLVTLLLVTACNSTYEHVAETHPDGSTKVTVIYAGQDTTAGKIAEKRFYENGRLELEGQFDEAGQRQGQWTYYYKDGKRWSQGMFAHGLREGPYTVWYENGQKRYEGAYKEDEPTGAWTFWGADGSIQAEKDYGS
ncbi:MAG: hypothetical protein AAGB22_13650, partial [Bacteroidota bacterium]